MRYSIALKDLPFEPEERQVIYVENQYDDRINALIKDNYEQIKWTFNRANLGFVYLPMFFNDEEIKDKILNIDIDTLTPIEALLKLNEIKKIVTKK